MLHENLLEIFDCSTNYKPSYKKISLVSKLDNALIVFITEKRTCTVLFINKNHPPHRKNFGSQFVIFCCKFTRLQHICNLCYFMQHQTIQKADFSTFCRTQSRRWQSGTQQELPKVAFYINYHTKWTFYIRFFFSF